jgi:hypothetical protein
MNDMAFVIDWIRSDARSRKLAGVSIRKPLGTVERLHTLVTSPNLMLPAELLRFYECCDGVHLGNWYLMQQKEVGTEWQEDRLLIQNWGNGDFDTIDISAGASNGRIWFRGHDPEYHFVVAPSLSSFLVAAYLAYRQFGEDDDNSGLMHPFDSWRNDFRGLYWPHANYPATNG